MAKGTSNVATPEGGTTSEAAAVGEQATMQLPENQTTIENKSEGVKELNPEDALKQMKDLLKSNPDLLKQILPEQPAPQTTNTAPPPQPTPTPTPAIATSRIFILANGKRKGDVVMDMTDDVIITDPKTGEKKTRRMRLIRGAQSIWQDEQTALPKEHIAKNQVTLTFSRGRCIIPAHETLKIQAALLSNRNTDNPNRVGSKDIYFYEWNPDKVSKQEEEKQNLIIKAMQIAATADFEDMKQHAQYLAVPTIDEMGIPLSPTSIRTAYSKKAMNEPEKFLNSIHSPAVKIKHLVRRGFDEGKIDFGRQAGQAFFTDGGFIAAIPEGKDALEYLTEFAMLQGEPNERFINTLKAILNTE